jgi:PST family polysaccharide transporter
MIERLKGIVKLRLVQNILALYGVRIVNQLMPLIIIPYLARVLEPTGWGMVAFAQAFAMYGIITIEYGFELTGVRSVAQLRHDPAELGGLIAGILGAQVLLSGAVALAALLVHLYVPPFDEQPLLVLAGLLFAILQGFAPIWYFIGQERVPLIAAIDTIAKIVATLLIFAFVRSIDDGWLVLMFYAVAAGISTVLSYALLLREARPRGFQPGLAWTTLKRGFSVFTMRIGVAMHTTGNTLLLGLLVPPAQVAFFAAGEKLCRPAAWLLYPINAALLPRLSELVGHSPDAASRMAGISLMVMLGIGGAFGLAIGVLAPWLIELMFGPAYQVAVPVLRVMAVLVPLIVLNGVLVSQWLVPHGLDRALTVVILSGGVANLLLALVVAPRWQALGMAWLTVAIEAGIVLGLLLVARRHGLRPFQPEILRGLLALAFPAIGRGR